MPATLPGRTSWWPTSPLSCEAGGVREWGHGPWWETGNLVGKHGGGELESSGPYRKTCLGNEKESNMFGTFHMEIHVFGNF